MKNQNLLNTIKGALIAAKSTFLPNDRKPAFLKGTADFFLKKAAAEEGEALSKFCLEAAIMFMFDTENLKQAAAWVNKDGEISIDGKVLAYKLTQEHNYQILQKVHASKDFNAEDRAAVKAKVFADDNSDKGNQVLKVAEYSLPDPDLKAKLWAELTDFESKDSIKESQQKAQGFMQVSFQ